jgi:hypothetical protein
MQKLNAQECTFRYRYHGTYPRHGVVVSWLAAASRWPHFGADAIAMLWDPDDFPNHNAPSPRCGGAVPVLKQLP